MTAQHSRDLRQIGSPCCYLTVIFPALRSGLPQRTLSACRGLPPIPGSPLYLHPPPYDPGGKGQRGRGDVCPRRAGPASAPRCSGHLQHLRYRNGAAEQSAADVFPPCKPLLPSIRIRFGLPCGTAASSTPKTLTSILPMTAMQHWQRC